jgi:hypothetical protein
MENISWTDRVRKMNKCYIKARRGGISYLQYNESRLTVLGTSGVGIYRLERVIEGNIERGDYEYLTSY